MNHRGLLVFLLLAFIVLMPVIDAASALSLPSLSASTFPAGTFVVPMDGKQADRVHVYGFIHEFLRNIPNSKVARIIEPPDVTLQTALTPSGDVYQGGPFLIETGLSSSVSAMMSNSTFSKVSVTTLSKLFTSNRVFFVRDTTKILVISDGYWGKTFLTLSRMGISYTQVSTAQIMANPSMVNQYTLIVLDSPGWYGNPSAYTATHRSQIQAVYDAIVARVQAGNEVMYTDAALLDLNSTFSGYIKLGNGGESGSWQGTVYNPPRGGFDSEFPSQYYNLGPNPNVVKIFTEEGAGTWVPTGVGSGHTQDVRILMDTTNFGVPKIPYAILAFYFPYGNGIVEGLALQPYQQLFPTYADQNGYYAVYEIYGNKFVEGLPRENFSVSATPLSQTVSQGQAATYSVSVSSFGSFSAPVTLQVTGAPTNSAVTFSQSPLTPAQGASLSTTLTIQTATTTPVGSFNLTITGTSILPAITQSVTVALIVQPYVPPPSDFTISVSPAAPTPVIVPLSSCGNATITVQSISNFSSPVTLTLSGAPDHVTSRYLSNPVTPSVGGTVVSTLQICAASNVAPGNYTMVITGTSGSTAHTMNVLLNVQQPVSPTINPLIYLVLLALLLLALGLGLLAFVMSSRRRQGTSRRRPLVQYVLPLPTIRCRGCGRVMPLHAVFCPYCGRQQQVTPPPMAAPPPGKPGLSSRTIRGFALSLVSGILVLLNSAALLAPSFYSTWAGIFFWLPSIGGSNAFIIGLLIGMVLIMASVIMVLGNGVFADVLIFPFAIFSLIIGGGFIVGMLLGIVGGILAALKR